MFRGRFHLLIAAFLSLIGFLSIAPQAQAQNHSALAGRPLKICVLPDTGAMNAAELIAHPERFDCTTPQHKLGPGNFWVISEDINQRSRSREPLNARVASLWQDRLSLNVLYADGRMITMATGKRGVTPLIQLGALVEHPLPRFPSEIVRLMWHVEGSANVRGILLGPRLSTAA